MKLYLDQEQLPRWLAYAEAIGLTLIGSAVWCWILGSLMVRAGWLS